MINESQKVIIEIRTEYWSYAATVPIFINNTNQVDINCFNTAKDIYKVIVKCFTDEVLKNITINKIIDDINTLYHQMIEESKDIFLFYYGYFVDMLKYFRDKCQDEELYEACANLEKIIDSHKNE